MWIPHFRKPPNMADLRDPVGSFHHLWQQTIQWPAYQMKLNRVEIKVYLVGLQWLTTIWRVLFPSIFFPKSHSVLQFRGASQMPMVKLSGIFTWHDEGRHGWFNQRQPEKFSHLGWFPVTLQREVIVKFTQRWFQIQHRNLGFIYRIYAFWGPAKLL